jgi:hypothetical protein
VFFDGVVGELPDWVVDRMALPEPVKKVRATSEVLFHWAKHGQNKKDMRGDTGTYQWVAECARAAISNPCALIRGKKAYQIIGKVERPNPGYPDVQYVRLVLKSTQSPQQSRTVGQHLHVALEPNNQAISEKCENHRRTIIPPLCFKINAFSSRCPTIAERRAP